MHTIDIIVYIEVILKGTKEKGGESHAFNRKNPGTGKEK